MPQYRVFTLDVDGHIYKPPRIIDAGDDLAAVQLAKKAMNEHTIEVWDGPRQIAKLDAERTSPPIVPPAQAWNRGLD